MHPSELKQWRARNGYTQQTMADLLFVTIGHYRKYEYGISPIPRRIGPMLKMLDDASGVARVFLDGG